MNPGNAQALVSMMDKFSAYSEFPISLGGDDATIYHTQFAKYPIERAARVLHDQFPIDPQDYHDNDTFASLLLDCDDQVEDIIRSTPGLSAGIKRTEFFDYGQRFDEMPLGMELVKLSDRYCGESDSSPYEAARRIPENKTELVADLLTMYHVELASMSLLDISDPFYDADWTEREAAELLTAMRAVIETQHGWTTFDTPSPSEDELTRLYTFCEEAGIDPAVDWVYALYIRPRSAMRYAPNDSLTKGGLNSVSNAINSMLSINTNNDRWEDETA